MDFERCFAAGSPVAIKGSKAQRRNTAAGLTAYGAARISTSPFYLVPSSLQGSLLRVIRPRSIYSRELRVHLPEQEVSYSALLGTSALLISPLLHWAFGLQQRAQDTAIIC